MHPHLRPLVPALLLVCGLLCAEEDNGGAPPPDAGGGAQTKAQTKSSPLGQALAKVALPRTPAGVLAALDQIARGLPPAGAKPDEQAKRFAVLVQAGDWAAVSAVIAALPTPAEQKAAYDHLLEALGGSDTLLPGDVLGLIATAPVEPEEARTDRLGSLLGAALGRVQGAQEVLATLETGVGAYGGTDAAARQRTARLLLAAGQPADALGFLPPVETLLAAADLDGLELHARAQAAKAGQPDAPQAALLAWTIAGQVLDRLTSAADEPTTVRERRARCLALRFTLFERVPERVRDDWMRTLFQTRPDLGRLAFAAAAKQVQDQLKNHDPGQRQKGLDLQHRLGDGLLRTVPDGLAPWRRNLTLAAQDWLREARFTRQSPLTGMAQMQMRMSRMPYWQQQQMQSQQWQMQQQSQGQPRPITYQDLLRMAPEAAWLTQLDPALGRALRVLSAQVLMQGDDPLPLDRLLALARQDAGQAEAVIAAGFPEWLTHVGREESSGMDQQMMMYQRYYGGGSGMPSGAIPLTRAKQVRDLERLGGFLRAAAELHAAPKPALQVQAFVASHSPAEVFRRDDLVAVLGEPAAWNGEVLEQVVDAMRSRLAGVWRKPDTQQQNQTKRSDAQTVAEVARGYDLATALLAGGSDTRRRWQTLSVLGALRFDQAEFQYGQKAKLEVYIGMRDAAFIAFAEAAAAYAASPSPAGEDPTRPPSAESWLQWFQSALGASDLAYLTRQQEVNEDQVGRIAATLRGLPGDQVARHLDLFCTGIRDRLHQVPAQMKVRYLRNAMRIIGDHPAGASLRTQLAAFDDLLGELALSLAIDGGTSVGDQPFGVHVALRHGDAVGREAGGFERLLRNQQWTGSGQVNYRDDFEKRLRDGLAERFTVLSVTFHKPEEAARPFGRDGWREKPLAYLLLKAKDPAVDRLPSVAVDLDFNDAQGPVVLPVPSPVVVIDARPGTPPAASATSLTCTQILDDRELAAAGTIALDVAITGTGLVGPVAGLLDLAVPGLVRTACEDQGVNVTGFDLTGERIAVTSERRAHVVYRTEPGSRVFAFPRPRSEAAGPFAKQERKRYQDADLVEAGERADLGVVGIRVAPMIAAGVVALLALAAVLVWRRRRSQPAAAAPRYRAPTEATPFAVHALLSRMRADQALALAEDQRRELDAAITALGRRFFAPQADTEAAPDLATIASHWVTAANHAAPVA